MAMSRATLRDASLAMFVGAAAPWLLVGVRQPASLGVLLGAAAGFWLGARSTSTRSAN
jgi:hypothetical protein